jgi:hypothetical protein
VRQPNPLDPFLIVTGKEDKTPPFGDAVKKIAFDNGLSLTVLDINPATQVRAVNLAMTKWPDEAGRAKVINQESWSAPSNPGHSGYEWGGPFLSPGGPPGGLFLGLVSG